MGVLLKIIIFIMAAYYLMKIVGGFLMRTFLNSQIKNFQEQMERQREQYAPEDNRKEGEISVKNAPVDNSASSIDDGEYIEYEDVS